MTSPRSLKAPLSVSAYTLEGEMMGIRSADMMLEEVVQFHPEPIATPRGSIIFNNFLDLYVRGR
ncbi:hypothetical protein DFAR_2740021 [Desulfarculales bacterium]